MTINKLLLCTDLDRTIIPNGRQPEHPQAREQFRQLCALPEVILVYVTGRHQQLVKEAIEQYALPNPDFVITDVGTRIFELTETEWHELLPWQEQIAAAWHGKSHDHLRLKLNAIKELQLQEQSKQNKYKLSYYLALDADRKTILKRVEQYLNQLDVSVSMIWSVDEEKQIGLLDILPSNATKRHAIEFLQQQLGYSHDQLIFAGDSGNDLAVLTSPIRSILVANAEQQIKEQAQQLTQQNSNAETLYLAQENNSPLGGNYSAGVVQGVLFFAPEFGAKLGLS